MELLITSCVLILTAILLGASYFIVKILIKQRYWKNRKIYTLKTRVPIIGHMAKMALRKESFPDAVNVRKF
jgi:uncharacterized Fe-S cluster-containing radical SAM superfamily enzyme